MTTVETDGDAFARLVTHSGLEPDADVTIPTRRVFLLCSVPDGDIKVPLRTHTCVRAYGDRFADTHAADVVARPLVRSTRAGADGDTFVFLVVISSGIANGNT